MQNLNNFILENIGLAALVVLILFLGNMVFLLLRRDKSNIKDILLQSQGELSGRLALLHENNRQEQSRIFQALNEQKMTVLKMMDEKLLAVTKSVGEGLQQSTNKTNETLAALRERLAKIDAAQQII